MKKHKIKFIKRMIVFLVVFVLLTILFNTLYFEKVLKHTWTHRAEEQFMENLEDRSEIIFLGDSHTQLGVDPTYINKSFNYASSGEMYEMTYFKLKGLLENGIRPRIIVLPIDFNSFAVRRDTRFKKEWYWRKYIDYLSLTFVDKDITLLGKWVDSFIWFKGKGVELLTFKPRKISKLILGHFVHTGNLAKDNNKSLQYTGDKKQSDILKDDAISRRMYTYYEKTIKLANKEGIIVVLVKYPITERYYYNTINREIGNSSLFYSEILDTTRNMSNIYVLDYQQTYSTNFSMFKDHHHLNHNGSKIFSQAINVDFKEFGLI